MKKIYKPFHLFFAVLNLITLIYSFILAAKAGEISIYFSYFTILSNILITVIFLLISFNKKVHSQVYAAGVLYMCVTGIVFWTILKDSHTLAPTEWATFVLHGIMPIAAFLSWIFYPPKNKFKTQDILKWLIFPTIFVIYTLIRGPIVHWYPYPFLNPNLPGGYFRVSEYIVGILIGIFILSEILIWTSHSKLKPNI